MSWVGREGAHGAVASLLLSEDAICSTISSSYFFEQSHAAKYSDEEDVLQAGQDCRPIAWPATALLSPTEVAGLVCCSEQL